MRTLTLVGAFLLVAGGPSPQIGPPVRYRFDFASTVDSSIGYMLDSTVMSQIVNGRQVNTNLQTGEESTTEGRPMQPPGTLFITVTRRDSAGYRLIRAVLDSAMDSNTRVFTGTHYVEIVFHDQIRDSVRKPLIADREMNRLAVIIDFFPPSMNRLPSGKSLRDSTRHVFNSVDNAGKTVEVAVTSLTAWVNAGKDSVESTMRLFDHPVDSMASPPSIRMEARSGSSFVLGADSMVARGVVQHRSEIYQRIVAQDGIRTMISRMIILSKATLSRIP